ncbi:MAG: ABC transporter ATP-binding protein [Oxalicibacterium faecigallinarum]|uniref:ABC transporter ATP-binding protein n=1 Tax=Oxalicibacterium faecigallinarum TaxID=573741 RepID=UPI0028076888|nr:ABC transporter ATP-binding protein [Oxalicibacterium faecigallinarum]MDQ7969415.1 ABC transporter ATP-binding protein [Oxalicibacterium faecigallinarum]
MAVEHHKLRHLLQRHGDIPLLRLSADDNKKLPGKQVQWRSTLLRLAHYLQRFRLRLIMTVLMIVASATCISIAPYLLGQTIDTFLVKRETGPLLFSLGLLALLYLSYMATTMLQSYLMISVAQRTVAAMRHDLFIHLHRLPIPFYSRYKTGELMSRFTNDIDNISQTLSTSFIQILSSALGLLCMLTLMFHLSPILAILTLLVIPVMHYAMRWITARTSLLFKQQQRQMGDFTSHVEEMLSGHEVVKAFGREEAVIARFDAHNLKLRFSSYWSQTYSGFVSKVTIITENLSFAIIVGSGSILVVQGLISIGTIIAFTEYARQLTRPLTQVANQFNQMLAAIAGAERAFEILDEAAEPDSVDPVALPELIGALEFSNVSFSYDESNPALTQLNFRADPGQMVALVGTTGAGKSTVLQLISRFYDAGSGEIRVDGHDIRQIARGDLRRQMGFVLQDAVLFTLSIRENIRYGNLDASDEDVVQAAMEANAYDFIMQLPQQFDTILHPQSNSISQGQRQLIAIARAILANPSILILDEATSSIDSVTERQVQQALSRLMQGRTSLVIAHRLHTIQKADLIIVLEAGRSIEQGSHAELMAQQGAYYQLQQAGKRPQLIST